MSIAELFSKIVETQKARRAKYDSDFNGIVKAVCDGKAPKPEAIEDALRTAGKTVEDLQAAVELRQQRMVWAADLKRLDDLDIERQQVERDIRGEEERFAPILSAHEQVVGRLSARLVDIRATTAAMGNPVGRLLESAPAAVHERLTAIQHKQGDLERQIDLVSDEASRLRAEAGAVDARQKRERVHPDDIATAQQAIALAVEKEQSIAALQGQVAALVAEAESLTRSTLTP